MTAMINSFIAPVLNTALKKLSELVKANCERGARTLIFCEDRLTLAAERTVCAAVGGSFTVNVCTFARFLAQQRGKQDGLLTRQGSAMIVRSLIQNNRDRLTTFKKLYSATAAQDIYDTIALLYSSRVTPEDIAAANCPDPVLRAKLEDLAFLYAEYVRFLEDSGSVDRNRYLALLPEVLPLFRDEFPMVEFSLFEGNSTQLEDELAHGRTDLIICFQPIMLEGVLTVPLTEQQLVMVVPKTFTDRLFGDRAEAVRAEYARGADISAFQKMPFVLIKRGNRTRSIVEQYFSRYYFKPKLILETENTVTTLAMAQAGVGITICPELFLRAMPAAPAKSVGVDFFPLTDPSTFGRLVAGYRQDRYLPHFGERFIALLQQAMTGDQK